MDGNFIRPVPNAMRPILFALTLVLCACSGRPTIVEQQKAWGDRAYVLDVHAADWQRTGPREIAEYYQDVADRARHNRGALGCDLLDEILDVLLNSDDCAMQWQQ
jgi:hypothetical protein